MKVNSGIYSILNIENGKVYVGSTIRLKRRWSEHRDALRHSGHGNPHLQSAWSKYGEKAFEFMVCEYVDDLEQLIDREQYWLDFHRMYVDVYNCGPAAYCPARGRMCSEEHKCNLSKALVGNQNALGHVVSDESRCEMSRIAKNRPSASEETRQKISKGLHNMSPEARDRWLLRLSETSKKRRHTEESKQKISKKMMGNQNSLGHQNHLGHKHSEETRQKQSESAKRMWEKRRAMGVASL